MKIHSHSKALACSVFFSLAAVAGCSVVEGQTYPYTVHDLGTLPGTGDAYGNALNNKGQVTGGSNTTTTGADTAFLTGANGAAPLLNLFNVAGNVSNGIAINDSGVVTGFFYTADNHLHGFITAANGASPRDIATLGGSLCQANDVNAGGQVAGRSFISGDMYQHAFISEPDGGALRDLGTLGGNFSQATGINDDGAVAGTAYLAGDTISHAFLSAANGGALMDLETLGGVNSTANGVNDTGQVVGYSNLTGDATYHGFVTGPGGAGPLVDLETLGGQHSMAKKINNHGDIIGSADSATASNRPFLYTASAGMQDFTTLIDPSSALSVISLSGINEFGQITGIAMNSVPVECAFLANPRYIESFFTGIAGATFASGSFTAAIQGFAGHTYQLERTATLNPAAWASAGAAMTPASDTLLMFVDGNAGQGGQFFYRVTLMP